MIGVVYLELIILLTMVHEMQFNRECWFDIHVFAKCEFLYQGLRGNYRRHQICIGNLPAPDANEAPNVMVCVMESFVTLTPVA